MLTAERLRELLIYNPATGDFFWRHNAGRHGRIPAGTKAGHLHADHGYYLVCIDGKDIRAHRLAWLYVYGEWPAGDLDHRDLNRSNNAIANLRLATDSQNHANRGRQKNNTSGIKGVSWYPRLSKWRAAIKSGGKIRHIGYFSDKEAAGEAYAREAKIAHGEFARLS